MNPMTRQHEQLTSPAPQPNRHRRLLLTEDAEYEREGITLSPEVHGVTAVNVLLHILKRDATQPRRLYTQVPIFKGCKRQAPRVLTSTIQPFGAASELFCWNQTTLLFPEFLAWQSNMHLTIFTNFSENDIEDVLDKALEAWKIQNGGVSVQCRPFFTFF